MTKHPVDRSIYRASKLALVVVFVACLFSYNRSRSRNAQLEAELRAVGRGEVLGVLVSDNSISFSRDSIVGPRTFSRHVTAEMVERIRLVVVGAREAKHTVFITDVTGARRIAPDGVVQPKLHLANDLPDSALKAVLRLDVHRTGGRGGWNSRSRDYPVGSAYGSDGRFNETRIVAIRPDGFEVLITEGQGQTVQRERVFFPYRQKTEATIPGYTVIGEFK